MQSAELMRRIRRIDIKAHRLVDELFSGAYRSGFRGKGMAFESIRLYVPGDDIRSIDWNVTARQNRAYVKQFQEEREMNLYLLIDMSRSGSFGQKKERIAEISATLAFSATRNNDRVGVLFFTDKVEKVIPSRSGRQHVLSIIEQILTFTPKNRGTSIKEALSTLALMEKRRAVVFLLSDFLDTGYEKTLAIASRRYDLINIRVADRAEENLPRGAIFTFEDLETGETHVLDNTKKSMATPLPPLYGGKNVITIYTEEDFIKPLIGFFRMRKGVRS